MDLLIRRNRTSRASPPRRRASGPTSVTTWHRNQANPTDSPRPCCPTRFMPSFQSPLPISGGPCTATRRLRSEGRAACSYTFAPGRRALRCRAACRPACGGARRRTAPSDAGHRRQRAALMLSGWRLRVLCGGRASWAPRPASSNRSPDTRDCEARRGGRDLRCAVVLWRPGPASPDGRRRALVLGWRSSPPASVATPQGSTATV